MPQRAQLHARASAPRGPPDGGASRVGAARAAHADVDDDQLAPEQASLLMVRRNILASACGGDEALRDALPDNARARSTP